MQKIKEGMSQINRYSGGLVAISLVGVIIPVLVLCGFGLYFIIRHGYTFYFAGILLLSALLVFISKWVSLKRAQNRQKSCEEAELVAPSMVAPSSDWSEVEQKIWDELNVSITDKLQQNSDWSVLRGHSLALALETAQAFGKKEFDFTVPEGLQLLEEISRRYRKVLNEHIPAIDKVSVSQAKWLFDAQNKYGRTAKRFYDGGSLAWRAYRMLNPAAAIANEIKRKIFGSMTDQVYLNLQNNGKRALLQEVVKVCIDLYSGRFTIELSQVKHSKISQQDEIIHAEFESVRVTIIGQVSAGKSSLVNALTKKAQAEVDPLPTTDDICVYPVLIEGKEHLRFIDMPGLDGSETTQKMIVKQVINSDLVLWVLKANQSARKLDVELLAMINAFYGRKENISRKKPRIVAVLNHVDRLKPMDDWAPPYDLNDKANPKVQSICAALAFNQEILAVDAIYPLGIPDGKPSFGIEALENEIQKQYDHAINVQLNRRRNEAKDSEGFVGESIRLFKASKEIVKNII